MTEDIRNRLEVFCRGDYTQDMQEVISEDEDPEFFVEERDWQGLLVPIVERIALNMDQIADLNPPPNPAKLSDSRAEKYIALYGPESWELDAIPPDTLAQLVEDEILARMDLDLMEAATERQEAVRGRIRRLARQV